MFKTKLSFFFLALDALFINWMVRFYLLYYSDELVHADYGAGFLFEVFMFFALGIAFWIPIRTIPFIYYVLKDCDDKQVENIGRVVLIKILPMFLLSIAPYWFSLFFCFRLSLDYWSLGVLARETYPLVLSSIFLQVFVFASVIQTAIRIITRPKNLGNPVVEVAFCESKSIFILFAIFPFGIVVGLMGLPGFFIGFLCLVLIAGYLYWTMGRLLSINKTPQIVMQ